MDALTKLAAAALLVAARLLPAAGASMGLLTTFLAGTELHAQARTEEVRVWIPEADQLQELLLNDGSTLIGRVIDDGDPIRFALVSGAIVEVQRSQLQALRLVEGQVRDGRLWRRDPSANRMFFGPTGRNIGAGRGYFAVFEVFFPAVGFGLTDSFSIAGGTLLLSDLGSERPVWVIPILQLVNQETFDFSVGALAISSLDTDFGSVGVLFGVGTFGTEDSGVTVGAGWGWVDDDLASTPAILFGAESRVSPSAKLMTENYLIPTGGSGAAWVLSAGPRFMGERLSADIALAFSIDSGDSAMFPLVNFVWNW